MTCSPQLSSNGPESSWRRHLSLSRGDHFRSFTGWTWG